MNNRPPRVIGLDLSLTGTGISDGAQTWLVKSTGHKGDTLLQRRYRLVNITREIRCELPYADLVVIEQPAFSRTTGHMHDRSGLWWLVVDELHAAGVPVVEVSPSALKKYATGKGNANKGAMIDATARRFPDIDTGGGDDNRCDSLWLAALGLDYLTGAGVVPASHRAVLAGVAWPAGLTGTEAAA